MTPCGLDGIKSFELEVLRSFGTEIESLHSFLSANHLHKINTFFHIFLFTHMQFIIPHSLDGGDRHGLARLLFAAYQQQTLHFMG